MPVSRTGGCKEKEEEEEEERKRRRAFFNKLMQSHHLKTWGGFITTSISSASLIWKARRFLRLERRKSVEATTSFDFFFQLDIWPTDGHLRAQLRAKALQMLPNSPSTGQAVLSEGPLSRLWRGEARDMVSLFRALATQKLETWLPCLEHWLLLRTRVQVSVPTRQLTTVYDLTVAHGIWFTLLMYRYICRQNIHAKVHTYIHSYF